MQDGRSLSVCCITAGPGARLVAALAPLRALCDEVVIAVDARVPEFDLDPLAAIADRLLRVEVPGPVESALAWLHAQCSGDWILRLDDDEVCSAGLLERLPELLRARDVAQYHLPRRCLFPDVEHWLDEWPWTPDYQTRLYRNDPLLWFSGLAHSSAEVVFPHRTLEYGLYHLDALLSSPDRRAAKVDYFESLDPAEIAPGWRPALQAALYLPEQHARRAPVGVTPEDRPAISAAWKASGKGRNGGSEVPAQIADRGGGAAQRAGLRAGTIPVVPAEEVQRSWAPRQLAAGAYAAHIEPLDPWRLLEAEEHRPIRVWVRNEGEETWPGGERAPLIRLAYRWVTQDGPMPDDVPRSELPHRLAPGQECVAPVTLIAPSVPGAYRLEFDLVHEFVRWFGARGETLEFAVIGRSSRPVPELRQLP